MITAFIPARSGSKRVPRKNIRPFFGHPLIAYAIQGAIDAGIFDGGIYVSSDSEEIGFYAEHYGAKWIRRPAEFATDTSPDAEWIEHAQKTIGRRERFAILRPTSPFRTGHTIRRAYGAWDEQSHLKAIEPVKQRPEKMWWLIDEGRMHPVLCGEAHLRQSSEFRPMYIQNGCLEFRAIDAEGPYYQAFFTRDHEGFDINTPEDWILAEALVERGLAKPPKIEREYCAPPF